MREELDQIHPFEPQDGATNWVGDVEELRRQMDEMFLLDAELLRGLDPLSEPAYVEAERIRRYTFLELGVKLQVVESINRGLFRRIVDYVKEEQCTEEETEERG